MVRVVGDLGLAMSYQDSSASTELQSSSWAVVKTSSILPFRPSNLKAIHAAGYEGDVRKRNDAVRVLESTIKQFGRLDILVNAAAGNFLVAAEDLSPNGFRTGYYLTIFAAAAG